VQRPWMRCSVAIELVGQTSSLTSKTHDLEGAEAIAVSQSLSDQG
jgi:hypothetical protein